MKKSNFLFYSSVGVIVVCIVLVVIFKFIIKTGDSFYIRNFHQLIVFDLEGNEIELKNFLAKDEPSYFLIFDLNDCFSCIYRGLEDLKSLKSKGKNCFGLVVHDYTEEVKGWASNYEFSPFLMLKRVDFFEKIKSAITPVFVKVREGKVESYRYITTWKK